MISVCHGCGADVTYAAGHMSLGMAVVLVCHDCLTRPLAAVLDPRSEGVCGCARPVPCPCGRSCFMCRGDLPSTPAMPLPA
jgi:hypothetical protein